MLKRITLLIVALAVVSAIASAPLNAAVGVRVFVGPRTFVPPAHPYWSRTLIRIMPRTPAIRMFTITRRRFTGITAPTMGTGGATVITGVA
jgi:hypothetical protein